MRGSELAKPLIQTQSIWKQEFQGSTEASSVTIFFLTNAQPELLNFVNPGSPTFLKLTSSWLQGNLLGAAFFVDVAFGKHYHNNEGDFAIRCMCNLKFPDGAEEHTLERLFYCSTQYKRRTRIRGDHTCIFYDT